MLRGITTFKCTQCGETFERWTQNGGQLFLPVLCPAPNAEVWGTE